MIRQIYIVAMLIAVAMCLQSCSRDKTKKGAADQGKTATAAGEQNRGGNGAANPASASAIPVKQRTPAELLAALPCKMADKKVIFAVFPDNTTAGQICFGLYPAPANAPDIRKFDIKAGGMHIIFHGNAGSSPIGVKLMAWDENSARPCLEIACGKDVPVKTETWSAPGEARWTYTIITPDPPIDFASVKAASYGLVMGADRYIPLFQ